MGIEINYWIRLDKDLGFFVFSFHNFTLSLCLSHNLHLIDLTYSLTHPHAHASHRCVSALHNSSVLKFVQYHHSLMFSLSVVALCLFSFTLARRNCATSCSSSTSSIYALMKFAAHESLLCYSCVLLQQLCIIPKIWRSSFFVHVCFVLCSNFWTRLLFCVHLRMIKVPICSKIQFSNLLFLIVWIMNLLLKLYCGLCIVILWTSRFGLC